MEEMQPRERDVATHRLGADRKRVRRPAFSSPKLADPVNAVVAASLEPDGTIPNDFDPDGDPTRRDTSRK